MINLIGINGYIGSGKDTVGQIIRYITSECYPVHGKHNRTFKEFLERGQGNNNFQTWYNSDWEIRKFAGKLKQIASILTGIPVEKFEDQEFKKSYLGEEWDRVLVPNIEQSRYYPAECMECGWQGSSSKLEGGYQIADTGDYGDVYCPKCGSTKIDDTDNVHQIAVREFLQKLGTEAIRNGLHENAWVNATFADYKPIHEISMNTSWTTGDTAVYPKWILTDCRFPNEASGIERRDGKVIRVIRGEEWYGERREILYGRENLDLLFQDSWYVRYRNRDNNELIHVFIGDRMGGGLDQVVFENPSSMHESETGLDTYKFDWYILNTKDINHLIEEVKRMLLHFGVLSKEVINN